MNHFCISALLFTIFIWSRPVSPFHQVSFFPRPAISRSQQYHLLTIRKGKKGGGAIERPQNEFSRTVPSDKILKLHGKHQRNRVNSDAPQRQYSVDIEASLQECEALADRFQLSEIGNLEASLSLSPEGNSAVESDKGILVQGTIHATVTQTCVRTNENFQLNLEFPLYSIVRPVDGIGPTASVGETERETSVQLNRDSSHSRKRVNQESTEEDLEPHEMFKIQSMLEDMEQHEESYDDVLMEDENIYGSNGVLDVGELVAQLFWLQLDPYPKKPGTEFSTFSISG